jgi:hypothetical protein
VRTYLLTILLALFISGCAVKKTTGDHNTDPEAAALTPTNEHKMASYFQESRALNNSNIVSELILTAQKNPDNSEPLYSLGYLHMQNGIRTKNVPEIKLAEAYLTQVIKQFPGNYSVLQALYNIHYDNILRKRDPEALKKAKAVFMQLPESFHRNMNPPSLAKYAATAAQQEQEHETNRQVLRDILLDAIHESPTTDTSYIQLAKLYREDRYFALALATLKQGEENISNSAELYQAIADTYNERAEVKGCSYENTSDIRNSSKYYQLAIPFNPDNQDLHYALSQSFIDQNLNYLGLNEAKIALELKSSAENISINAQNLSILGYHQQALELLQQAMGNGYSSNRAGYHEIYMNKGDWKNAAAGFTNYIKNRDKFNVYDLIKGDIIAQQAHIPAWIINKNISTQTPWEKALLNYWRAHINAEELKSLAHTSCEKTEYYFYTGYRDLLAGNKVVANTKFTAAINQNTYRFIERPLARYFLDLN